MDLIKLNIVGYSRSEFQHGAYALILSEELGNRNFSIVIGACEAQSIAIGMESNIKLNRPLTHDLFKSLADSFNIELKYIYIYKIENGIFHSFLILKDQKTDKKIDARTSDAVAISIRFNVPIYTNEDVLKETKSIEKNNINEKKETNSKENPQKKDSNKKDIIELQKKLTKALEEENYELAAEIRDLINKKSKK